LLSPNQPLPSGEPAQRLFQPENASNAVFSTAIRRSSAESLAVRENEMTKTAHSPLALHCQPPEICPFCPCNLQRNAVRAVSREAFFTVFVVSVYL
jgi:hypothetical protein